MTALKIALPISLGTALFIWHQLLENQRQPNGKDSQRGSLLGPAFSDAEIAADLQRLGAVYSTAASDAELTDRWLRLMQQSG